MDYQTARQFLIDQAKTVEPGADTFLIRLRQSQPPVPGQVTSMLLALKVVFEALRGAETLDRGLVYALHLLATDSRLLFDMGQRNGVIWPPLLNEDLGRIAIAVKRIFAGTEDG
ncbi:Dethiobiotin synthetase [Oculatella sp. LEGE 06141]|uniref:Dethiobiotin synthetase n=1 Tax=Oculatella sp. LEGE 06141 TaxID=1828648 RepID=UPI0018820F2F|nr:Dethiobiotin synthetase [Oculatella sp. LEGE 06141]MBE9181397.1 Dethiobiotin synthetase [Oculatella sp. LEGE 06141]